MMRQSGLLESISAWAITIAAASAAIILMACTLSLLVKAARRPKGVAIDHAELAIATGVADALASIIDEASNGFPHIRQLEGLERDIASLMELSAVLSRHQARDAVSHDQEAVLAREARKAVGNGQLRAMKAIASTIAQTALGLELMPVRNAAQATRLLEADVFEMQMSGCPGTSMVLDVDGETTPVSIYAALLKVDDAGVSHLVIGDRSYAMADVIAVRSPNSDQPGAAFMLADHTVVQLHPR